MFAAQYGTCENIISIRALGSSYLSESELREQINSHIW